MSEYDEMHKDLKDMVEIIETTIRINAREESFYRRSAASSTREVAKKLFLEMADDFKKTLEKLQARRRKLLDAISDLEKARKSGNFK